MKNCLKIGVIGLGYGEKHLKEYQKNKYTTIDSICDFNNKKLKQIKKKYKINTSTQNSNLLINNKDIKIISIASYDNYHYSQLIRSIIKKKAVFVEKPLCLNDKEFHKINSVLKKFKKSKISTNFVLRNLKVFEKIRDKIKRGNFGEIYNLEAEYNYGRKYKITKGWRGQIPYYSVMHGGGIHLIDIMQWVTGLKIKKVFAISNKIATKKTSFKFPDNITSLIVFNNGAIGKISANFSLVSPHHHQIRIMGTKRSFFYNHNGAIEYSNKGNKNISQTIYKKEKYENFKNNNVLKSFIDYVVFNKKPIVKQNEVINTMNISLSIHKSLKKRKWIKIK